jgi:hypothetical protein
MPGDKVHLAAGNRMPLLLRLVEPPAEDGTDVAYALVDARCVHGIMDGEGITGFGESFQSLHLTSASGVPTS